jgi:hypothetical protein
VLNIQTDKLPLNHVTAVFTDGSQSFPLPQGTTLEQIADRIDRLARWQERETVAVVVKFAATALRIAPPKLPVPFTDGLLAEVPRLRAFARSMARDPDRADDLVQETLVKGWAHRSKFKEGTNLRAWLFTILRNTYFGNDPGVAKSPTAMAIMPPSSAANRRSFTTSSYRTSRRPLTG